MTYRLRSFIGLMALVSNTLPAQYTYTITNLGRPGPTPPGWSVVQVYGARNGYVVGGGNVLPSQAINGWTMRDGEWANIGLLAGGDQARALDVNASGHLVGYGTTPVTGGLGVTAILFRDGALTDLGVLGTSPYLSPAAGGRLSRANAINDHGQVVGVSTTNEGPGVAFLWEDGQMRSLGVLGGGNSTSEAYDVNNHGVAVGVSGVGAVVFQNGQVTSIGEGRATVINDSGVIAGINMQQRAFVYKDGVMTDIGTLGGAARPSGINRYGQVVGQSTVGINPRCFLYDNGVMRDLATLADFSQDFMSPNTGSCAIDDDGRIWGTATGKTFQLEVYVLTPMTPPNPSGAMVGGQWNDAAALGSLYAFQTGSGWAYSPTLGYIYTMGYPWIYVHDVGWFYLMGGGMGNGAIFYSVAHSAYLWMSSTHGAWAYNYATSTWIKLRD